jgi:hypothetical protein
MISTDGVNGNQENQRIKRFLQEVATAEGGRAELCGPTMPAAFRLSADVFACGRGAFGSSFW